MNFKKSLDNITTRPMSRKDFLASIGAAILAMIGVSAILKSFDMRGTNSSQGSGYGSSSYGGGKES
jgi:hypothetical protein